MTEMKWNDRNPEPARSTVRSGQHGDLLERYHALAEIVGVRNPPPLRILHSGKLGQSGGANASRDGVNVTDKLVKLLSREEMDFVLAHELGHIAEQRRQQKPGSTESLKVTDDNAWLRGEHAADRHALKATLNPAAGISGLKKVTQEHLKEVREQLKAAGVSGAFDRAVLEAEQFANTRADGISRMATESGLAKSPRGRER